MKKIEEPSILGDYKSLEDYFTKNQKNSIYFHIQNDNKFDIELYIEAQSTSGYIAPANADIYIEHIQNAIPDIYIHEISNKFIDLNYSELEITL